MTLTEVMSSLGIDSINNGIKGFNAIKTACKANQVVNIAATLKFWTAVAMMVLGDTINPNTMQVGIRWVEKNYAPASLVEKASFGVFLSRRGTPKYQFGIDLKKGAAIRVNWTPFGDFSIQGGVNTKFDKITICGAPVAEASLQYRRGVVVNPNKYRSPSVWSLGVQIEVLNAMRFQVKLAGTDASPIF
jgi:hypothetical protein